MTVLPKGVRKEIESDAHWLARAIRSVVQLATTQSKHTRLIETQAAQIEALTARVAALELREDVLLARAEKAAVQASSQIVTDLARRVGFIEGSSRRD